MVKIVHVDDFQSCFGGLLFEQAFGVACLVVIEIIVFRPQHIKCGNGNQDFTIVGKEVTCELQCGNCIWNMFNDIQHSDPVELFVRLIGIEQADMDTFREFSGGVDNVWIRLHTGHGTELAQRWEKETVAATYIQYFSSLRQRFFCFLMPAIECF